MFALGAIVVWNEHWWGLLQLAFFLFATAYLIFKDGGLPPLLKSLFVLAALINAQGWIWDEYTRIVWYNEFAHLFTSFAIALVLGFFSYRRAAGYLHDHHLDYFVVVVCFGVTAVSIWEALEWFIVRENRGQSNKRYRLRLSGRLDCRSAFSLVCTALGVCR